MIIVVAYNPLRRDNTPSFTMTGGVAGSQVILCGEWVAYPDRGAGNDPNFFWGEVGGVVFHHQGSTFLQWAIWE